MPPASTSPVIALLAEENTSPSVLYGLYDVLYSVGAVYPDMTVGEPGPEALDVRIISREGRPFRCIGGVSVEPHASMTDIQHADAVVVCDMYSPIHSAPVGAYPEITAWLRALHAQGTLICSVCSGSLVLAEAGLLDGRDAAGHWAYGEMFALAYPEVRLQKNDILCLGAEADGIVTAGGVTSWQDLALYLIARHCGRRKAIETAKVFLLAAHEEGQLPFAAMNRRVSTTDTTIANCQEWIAARYMIDNPVQAMTERSGLNARTFARRFRAATGQTPLDYVQALRIEEAKQMLETGAEAIDDVGIAVGYEDPASFRKMFQRRAGLSPAAYRRRFATAS
jgi:transcriptional regulator GlxA family with amidase domain